MNRYTISYELEKLSGQCGREADSLIEALDAQVAEEAKSTLGPIISIEVSFVRKLYVHYD